MYTLQILLAYQIIILYPQLGSGKMYGFLTRYNRTGKTLLPLGDTIDQILRGFLILIFEAIAPQKFLIGISVATGVIAITVRSRVAACIAIIAEYVVTAIHFYLL